MSEKEEKQAKKTSTALTPYKPKPLALPSNNVGTIDDYIRAANSAPILTPEKERELAVRLRDHGDMEAASELIMSHLRLVISIARQYLGYGLPFSDLIQEGNIGLMKAVKRFNPDHGARLVTFAMTWIRSEIQEYVIHNWRLVKIATTKAQRKLFFNLRSLKEDTKLLKMEEANQIANKLDVKPSEVFEMEKRMLGSEVAIDEPGEEGAPQDWLTSEKDSPEALLEWENYEDTLQSRLPQAIKMLDDRSRKIIEARWLFDETGQSKGATLADLAKELGVSQERVRQIEKKALAKLKEFLKEKS